MMLFIYRLTRQEDNIRVYFSDLHHNNLAWCFPVDYDLLNRAGGVGETGSKTQRSTYQMNRGEDNVHTGYLARRQWCSDCWA